MPNRIKREGAKKREEDGEAAEFTAETRKGEGRGEEQRQTSLRCVTLGLARGGAAG